MVVALLEKSIEGEAPREVAMGVITDLGVTVGGDAGVGGNEGRGLEEATGGDVGAVKGEGKPETKGAGLPADLEREERGGEAGEAPGMAVGGVETDDDDALGAAGLEALERGGVLGGEKGIGEVGIEVAGEEGRLGALTAFEEERREIVIGEEGIDVDGGVEGTGVVEDGVEGTEAGEFGAEYSDVGVDGTA